MQTFLPLPSFEESARCLDQRRCGKQRIEAKQILQTIIVGGRWGCHPAVKQWAGYQKALCLYAIACCDEWVGRGFEDNQKSYFQFWFEKISGDVVLPPWFGKEDFHSKHRARLLGKKPEWYSRFNWTESPDPDIWTFAVPKVKR